MCMFKLFLAYGNLSKLLKENLIVPLYIQLPTNSL